MIEENDTRIEEVKAAKDQEKQMVIKDNAIELERMMFEKAKENYGQKKHLEQKDDQITKLNT